jgi:hypothetical protein
VDLTTYVILSTPSTSENGRNTSAQRDEKNIHVDRDGHHHNTTIVVVVVARDVVHVTGSINEEDTRSTMKQLGGGEQSQHDAPQNPYHILV